MQKSWPGAASAAVLPTLAGLSPSQHTQLLMGLLPVQLQPCRCCSIPFASSGGSSSSCSCCTTPGWGRGGVMELQLGSSLPSCLPSLLQHLGCWLKILVAFHLLYLPGTMGTEKHLWSNEGGGRQRGAGPHSGSRSCPVEAFPPAQSSAAGIGAGDTAATGTLHIPDSLPMTLAPAWSWGGHHMQHEVLRWVLQA